MNLAKKDTRKTKFICLLPEKWPSPRDKFQEDVDFRHEFPLIFRLDLEDTEKFKKDVKG